MSFPHNQESRLLLDLEENKVIIELNLSMQTPVYKQFVFFIYFFSYFHFLIFWVDYNDMGVRCWKMYF